MKQVIFFLVLMLAFCGCSWAQTPGFWQPADAINGLSYGLQGDSTDETTEMQAALRAMEANGLPLVLDSGIYLFTDTLNVRGHIYGGGSYIHFELDGTGDTAAHAFRMRSNSGLHDMEIDVDTSDAGGWDDTKSHYEYGAGIVMGRFMYDTAASNVHLSNLKIHGPERTITNGIQILGGCNNVVIENIHFVEPDISAIGINMHWGNHSAAYPDTVADTGTTYHPHNITIRNVVMDSISQGTYAGAIGISAGYNILVENVVINGPSDRVMTIIPGDYGYRYSNIPDSVLRGQGIVARNVVGHAHTLQGFFVGGLAPIIARNFGYEATKSLPVHLIDCQAWSSSGASVGFYFEYTNGGSIDHCWGSGASAGFSPGPHVSNLKIINSTFQNNQGVGIYLHHADSTGPENSKIFNNQVYSNNQGGTESPEILVSNVRNTSLIGNIIGRTDGNESCWEGLRVNGNAYNTTVMGNQVLGLHDSALYSNANASANGGAYTVVLDSSVAVWVGNTADTSLKYFSTNSTASTVRKAQQFMQRWDTAFFAGYPIEGTPPSDDEFLRFDATDSSWKWEAAPGAAGGDGAKVDTGDASVQVIDVGDFVLQEGAGVQFALDNDSIEISATAATFTWADSSGEGRYWVDSATYATHALETDSSGKALQDASGNPITSTYTILTDFGKVTDDTTSWIDAVALFDTSYTKLIVVYLDADSVMVGTDTIIDFVGSGLALVNGQLRATGSGGLWNTLGTADTIFYSNTETIIKITRNVANDTTTITGNGVIVIEGSAGETPVIEFGLPTDLDSIRFDSMLYSMRNPGSPASQSITKTHIDSTASTVIFSDAFRITSDDPDSSFMTKDYIDNVGSGMSAADVGDSTNARMEKSVTGNTETGIGVTYQSGDSTYDFVSEVTQAEFDKISDDTTNFLLAYGWGDHSTQNYLDNDDANVDTANWITAYTHSQATGNQHSIDLDDINDPSVSKTFSMAAKYLKYVFTTPADSAFLIDATGAFAGDLFHVHQHTGNPGAGATMIAVEANDADVLGLQVVNSTAGDSLAEFIGGAVFMDSLEVNGAVRTGVLGVTGAITVSSTVDGVDLAALNTDVAADSGSWNATADALGTAIDSTKITNANVAEDDLTVSNAPTDEYALTWEADAGTGGQMTWEAQAGGGGGLWDSTTNMDTVSLSGTADTALKITRDAGNDTTKVTVPAGTLMLGGAGLTTILDTLLIPAGKGYLGTVANGYNVADSALVSKKYVDDASGGLTEQSVKGDHVDSTAENFVFDDAYRGTSAVADSAYTTQGELGDSATAVRGDFPTDLGADIDSTEIDFTTMDEWVSDQIHEHLGGTETGIAVTGQEATNDIDFVITTVSGLAVDGNNALVVKPGASIDTTGGSVVVKADGIDSLKIANDQVNDLHIHWGTGTDEVSATDLPDFGTMTATANKILVADGSDFESVDMSGDATIASGGALTIAANAIESTMVGIDQINDLDINWGSGTDQVDLADIPGGAAPASAFDFGGATSFELPNGANPTVAATQVAWETDEFCFRVHDGTANRSIPTVQWEEIHPFLPDLIQDSVDQVPVLTVHADYAPFGIKILGCGISTGEASTYAVNFEEWSDPVTLVSTIEAGITTSASTEDEDDGTIDDSDIATGSYVMVDLPDTQLGSWLTCWISYYIKTGD